MLISKGTQERVITESPTGAGTTSQEGTHLGDSILVTLWVSSLPSGTLDVSVYTLTDTNREGLLLHFPQVTAGTTNLLLTRSASCLQRFRVSATYTGACTYEVYVRSLSGAASETISNTLVTDPYDRIDATYPSSTVEVYTYRYGGASGTIVGVVTVTYSDSSKAQITSVAKV